VRPRLTIVGRRCCAAVAACSAVLHGVSLVGTTNPVVSAVTVVMLAACLYCARDLWVRGTLRAWLLVALMNLAMIAIHMPMSAGHHHGGGVDMAAPAHHSTVMSLATGLAVVEVVAAAAVLFYRTRVPPPSVMGPSAWKSAPPCPRSEGVECMQNLRRAPRAVTGAVSELDDDARFSERVHIASRIAG